MLIILYNADLTLDVAPLELSSYKGSFIFTIKTSLAMVHLLTHSIYSIWMKLNIQIKIDARVTVLQLKVIVCNDKHELFALFLI